MKKTIFLLIIFVSLPLFCEKLLSDQQNIESSTPRQMETQSLLGDRHYKLTGFGGICNTVNSDMSFFGARGALVVNERFVLGVQSMNLVHPHDASDIEGVDPEQNEGEIDIRYGGALLGAHFFQKKLFNLSVTSIIGGGSLDITRDQDSDFNSSVFFLIEPTVIGYVNLTRWARAGAGLSYKYTKGIDIQGITDDSFRKMSMVLTIDFGKF